MSKSCDHVPRHIMQKPINLKSTSNFNCTFLKIIFHFYITYSLNRDSIVGIVTCYGLQGPGIKSWSGTKFSTDRPWGPPSLQYSTVFFLEVKQPWRDVDHTSPPRAEVKERVEL